MNVSTDSLQQAGQSTLSLIPLALQLYGDVRAFLKRSFQSGLFEVLEYDSTLELVDLEGKLARFKKRMRVKFLQDNVIAFQDYVWGDGEGLLKYRCSPGMVVDQYRDGGRWNILISLRETKATGDVEEFHIERELRGTFTAKEAWWQVSMQHTTRRAKVAIIFPLKRPCQRAVLMERNSNRSTPLYAVHFDYLPDGRQILTWESDEVKRFEMYTIKWQW